MMEVKEYDSSEAFGKGIDKMDALGWVLHSWRMVVTSPPSFAVTPSLVIVAVFKGRSL